MPFKRPGSGGGIWSQALGWSEVRVAPDGNGAECRSPGGGAYLEFVRVPEGKAVKNRVHLGCTAGDLDRLDDEIGRLHGLGATLAWEEEFPPAVAAVYRNGVLRDVEATSSASVVVDCLAHPLIHDVVVPGAPTDDGRPTAVSLFDAAVSRRRGRIGPFVTAAHGMPGPLRDVQEAASYARSRTALRPPTPPAATGTPPTPSPPSSPKQRTS